MGVPFCSLLFKVFFNAVVVDGAGDFVTGFKLYPGTQQFENFIKNGVLR